MSWTNAVAAPGDRLGAGEGRTPLGDRTFRPDIQGLRSVAVTLVVLYHCGVPGLAGGYVGVDVFFVISGFLITRQLISEHRRVGRISLSGFYARRIRRLLPSALTVILLTELAARLFGPPLQAVPTAKDSIFSTFYLMNYRLAAAGVDYQNAGGPVSPLQHFWSLAVEEQFYLFWPLAIIAVGLLFRLRMGRALGLFAALAVAVSFVVSVTTTGHDATLAYFAIQTRAWELGAGALVAVGTPLLLRLPVVAATAAGWCGLLMIVCSALVLTSSTPFPGSAAALPVAGAALVILAGLTQPRRGAELALQGPGAQLVGRMSYGWYLWHWPLIVLVPAVLGDHFTWFENVALALFGLCLAAFSNVLIEQRVARSGWGRMRWFQAAAAMSAVVTATSVLIMVLPAARLANSGQASALDLRAVDPAAMSTLLAAAYDNPSVPANLTPQLDKAVGDVPPTTANGCNAAFLVTTEAPCVFGDPSGSKTVVLFGDSHAEQWFGALDALATSQGWKLLSWTKAACPMADVLLMSAQLRRPFTECPVWHADTVQKITDLHPDLVIASGSDGLPGPGYSNATWSADTTAVLTTLRKSAKQLIYLADIPAPSTNVPVCLADHVVAPQQCQFSRASQTQGLTGENQFPGRHAAVIGAAAGIGIPVIDPTDWFCSPIGCPVIVADTLVYRDSTHMTQAYSRALEPMIGRALSSVVPWIRA